MVKFYENTFTYDYHWPTVTLAYLLRYPNPYSTHVISTDTLSTTLTPSGQLEILRLHLKRGKLPRSVARLIPSIKQSYILERSTIDPSTQTMTTTTRNLDWDGVLSVVENQTYRGVLGEEGKTEVVTQVRFESKMGGAAKGWIGSWAGTGVGKSLEVVGKARMREGLGRSREGMKVVLERLREKGFVGVVREQRQGGWERWKKVWRGENGEGMEGVEM